MSYCLNPKCPNPSDPNNAEESFCVNCGSELILQQRYRVIQPLGKGGCGEIFEVDDNGTRKVLKRLLHTKKKYIALFQQEARVLGKLRDPGIPQVESDGYFQYKPEGSQHPIHCLVMEKIEGLNLEEWLQQRHNQPISEEQAIAWLCQLVKILQKLHQYQYFHRDIKPSNIMLRSPLNQEDERATLIKGGWGDLVLIDFGTVREMTDTYLAKIAGNRELTGVHSAGYTPSEQINGKALPQSDFFALGRTFVHLLTGKEPIEFDEDEQLRLSWRESAPYISQPLADLIDWLMEPSPVKRPANTEIIRQYLQELQSGNLNQLMELKKLPPVTKTLEKSQAKTVIKPLDQPRWWKIVLLASLAVTGLVMGVRYLGWLQNWELQAFDGMMRSRPGEVIDPHLLVIEVTQEDLQKYVGNRYESYSLRDVTLAQLIQKLEKYQPRLIGLDMHRYQPRPPGRQDLIAQLQKNPNLLTVCAFNKPDKSYAPLANLQSKVKDKFGFSDLELDLDNIVRRQLLSYDPNKSAYSSTCTTPYSLSFFLAKQFFKTTKEPLNFNSSGHWYTEEVIFKKLKARTGGYQNLDGQSNQILINYRSPWGEEKIAKNLSLTQFLGAEADNQLKQLVNNKIVLIGYTAPVANDGINTPYGRIPGVWVHAHQLSQILSAVLDGRPLLWVLPQWGHLQWGDALWVGIWSVVGGLLAWRFRNVFQLTFFNSLIILVLYQACLAILIQGGWMPFVPPVLSLLCTEGFITYIVYRKRPS